MVQDLCSTRKGRHKNTAFAVLARQRKKSHLGVIGLSNNRKECEMSDTMEVEKGGEKPKTLEEALQEEEIDPDILNSSVDDITARTRALDREIQILRHEQNRLHHEQTALKEKIKENNEKIKLNKQLPYLVANVVEVHLDLLR
jgi:chromosome segregation ATPase